MRSPQIWQSIKMNRSLFLILIFPVLFLMLSWGCTSDNPEIEVVEFEEFQKEYELKSEPVEWLDIRNCGDMRIYDSIMVVVDWKRAGGSIRVFNLNTKTLIGAFGGFGKGPGEFFSSPNMTPLFSYQDQDLIIQLYDNGRRTFQNINLNKSIEKRRIVEISKFQLPDGLRALRSFISNDSLLHYPDFSVLHMYDFNSKKDSSLHDPIEFRQKFPSDKFEEIARIMYLEMDFNQEQIVGCFNVMRRLHIYSSNGDFLRIIMETGSNVFNLGDKDIYQTNKEHYRRSFLSNKYILVLDTDRIVGTAPPSNIAVFSYEGDALINYRLDSWIYYGAVDWKTNTLYTCDTQEAAMISYQLAGLN